MTEHPISLPPKLWEEWIDDGCDGFLAACEAARWGADQELEACCEWLSVPCPSYGRELRAARRPKPPSLAEEALVACERSAFGIPGDRDTIRRALERLQELEKGNE